MKFKNFTSSLLLLFIILVPLLNGCQKGDEDPFFSIYSRKARVVGDWVVNYYKSDVKTISGIEGTDQIRTLVEVNALNWEENVYILGTDSVRETKGKITVDNNGRARFNYNFNSNGIMTSIYEYQVIEEVSDEDMGTDTTITTTIKIEYSGTWNFLAGVDDYKNKERLALVIQEEKYLKIVTKYTVQEDDEYGGVTTTTREAYTKRFANGEMSTIWVLRMLKNKEMIMDQNVNDLYVVTDINGTGTSISQVGTRTQTLQLD
ncbi:MAG TPA: hypothetical protein PLP11_04895 [Bacteroidales bacterium]|nr:hypothetical protein [Bacteroidales bacterium]HQP03923.1 hypothetical protein [Bacteroidales bacterium]